MFFRTLFSLGVAFLLGGLFLPTSLWAAEYIPSFRVEATLDASRRLEITERIEYDFDENARHGIYRQIPITYTRGKGIYRLPIQVLGATMDGQPIALKKTQENGELSLRLGDPDRVMKGRHVFVIRYATDRVVTDWTDHQELYWNVNGNGWTVLTETASFTLRGPGSVQGAICYTGPEGSTEHACTTTVASSTAMLVTTRALAPAEGFTIAIAFPVRTMQPLPWWRILWYWLWEHPFVLLPFATFVVMFLLWWIRGRDPIGRGTIIPLYEEPRGLRPALLSALLHQTVTPRDATATILDLARKGYLTLKAIGDLDVEKGSWSITRTKKTTEGLLPFEETLLQGLASPGETMPLSGQPGTYSTMFYNVNKKISAELISRHWFVREPGQSRGLWFLLAFLIVFFSFIFAETFGIAFFFGAFLSAVIIAVFGWFMPKVTKEGAILTEEIEGLKHFLTVTEKDRLAFHDAPEKRPEQFSRLLAVAVALGVETKWAKQFESLMIPAPEYLQTNNSALSALALVHSIDHFNTHFSHGLVSPSSPSRSGSSGFSSGGSSGGGFGGGGGGSW